MRTIARALKRKINALLGKDFFEKIDCHIAKERFGSVYGGWEIARESLNKNSIIYSFGIGEDISFDLALIERFNVTVHGFDPTPKSIDWVKQQNVSPNFILHEYGIAASDRESLFFPPENPGYISHSIIERTKTKGSAIKVNMKRLSTIVKELGHENIDVLKMDIEGAEYEVIEDLRHSQIRPEQILIEFHHRFPNIGITKTQEGIRSLRQMGYKIFSISESGQEFSFILRN